jgi:AP-3 complex subunit sigma
MRAHSVAFWGEDTKLIYRCYATLYFIFVADDSESELGMLDLIQVLVELLDQCFENVCELDLIFHCDKVHQIVDEMVMGGLVLETRLSELVSAVREMNETERRTSVAGASIAAIKGRISSMKSPVMDAANSIKDRMRK